MRRIACCLAFATCLGCADLAEEAASPLSPSTERAAEPAWTARLGPDRFVLEQEGGALSIEPATLARGGRVLSSTPRGDGAMRDLGVAVERWALLEGGAEVTWTLERAPDGDGDLEIAMAFGGMRYLRSDARGVHLESDHGAGAVVSHAVLIDAAGARTAIETRAVGGALHVVVDEALLRGSAYPIVIDPVVSPEIILSPATSVAPFGWTVYPPRIARAPSGVSLAVWSDSRLAGFDIWAALVSDDGTTLRTNILVAGEAGVDERAPDVAWDGTQFVVAYQRGDDGAADVYAQRVAIDGALTGGPIAVSAIARAQTEPRITRHESGTAIVWVDDRNLSTLRDIYGARLGTDGTVLDPAGAVIHADTLAQGAPVIAQASAGSYLVVWQQASSDIYAKRFDAALTPGPALVITAAGGFQRRHAVATDGTGWMVTWDDSDEIHGRYVDAATLGTTFVVAPRELTTTRFNRDLELDGTHFVSFFQSGSVDQGQRITTTGTSGARFDLDSPSGLSAGFLDLVPTASGDWLGAHSSLAAYLFSPAGTLLAGPSPMATMAPFQSAPAVAFGDGVWLAAWAERASPSGPGTVRGAIVQADRSVSAPFTIGTGDDVAVCHDGARFLAVWTDPTLATDHPFYGARIDATGSVGAASTIVTTGDPTSIPRSMPSAIEVACDGTNAMAVYVQRRELVCGSPPCGASDDVVGTSLTTAGGAVAAVGGPYRFSGGSIGRDAYVTSTASGDFLVVFRDGTIPHLAVAPHALTGVTSISLGIGTPMGIASIGSRYAVALSSSVGFGTIGAAPGSSVTASARAIAWDGSGFFVVLRRSQDLDGRRFDSSGAPIDAAPFVIAASDDDELAPSLAPDGDSRLMVGYQLYDTTIGVTSARARARLVDVGPSLGTPCTSGSMCASGHCVDGVCCDTACDGGTADCQACSVLAGASVDGLCEPLAAGTVCRASSAECDAAEVCDGVATACPSDALAGSDVVCRPAAGGCDAAERCTGTSSACPPDELLAAGETCRAAAGDCDVGETCDGSSIDCPSDVVVAAGTTCRAAAGACDLAEVCDGASGECPADAFATTVCRPAAGECDVAESCTGSDADCPADAFASASTVCRASAGECDVDETCSGSSASCPSDALASAATVCRGAAGPCDVEETCSGASASCGPDLFLPSGAVCREAAGECDLAETCSGSSASCPSDAFASDGTACDDADECTTDDACSAGACVGVAACVEDGGLADDAGGPERDSGIELDGGAQRDSGAADAAREDAATPDAGAGEVAGGCSCRAAGGSPRTAWPLWMAIASIVLWRVRRRSRAT